MRSQDGITRKTTKIIVTLLSLSLISISVLCYFGNFNVLFELISHFKLHYIFLAITLLLINEFLNINYIRILLAITIVINLIEVLPLYIKNPVQASENQVQLKITTANIKFNNDKKHLFEEFAKYSNSDILMISEINQEWEDEMKNLQKLYPYFHIVDPNNNFGIAIFSKYELSNIKEITNANPNTPAIKATAKINENTFVNLIALHPTPPINEKFMTHRNKQFEEIANEITSNEMWIVAGDFNSTVWSPALKKFEQKTGLENLSKGNGIIPTWPSENPNYKNFQNGMAITNYIPKSLVKISPIKIQIDHIYASEEVVVYSIKSENSIGSDHLPLTAIIGIPTK